MKKKFLAMLMASVMVLGLAACGNSSQPAADSGDGEGDGGALPTVGVLIYKYHHTYISTVRNALQPCRPAQPEGHSELWKYILPSKENC